MPNLIRIGCALTILWLLCPLVGRAQTAEKVRGNVIGEWRSYGADLASTKYAPLDQTQNLFVPLCLRGQIQRVGLMRFARALITLGHSREIIIQAMRR